MRSWIVETRTGSGIREDGLKKIRTIVLSKSRHVSERWDKYGGKDFSKGRVTIL